MDKLMMLMQVCIVATSIWSLRDQKKFLFLTRLNLKSQEGSLENLPLVELVLMENTLYMPKEMIGLKEFMT